MDDECSMLSSCYWDAVSVTSDARTEHYHTPTGSITDIPDFLLDANSTGSLTPTFHDMAIHDNDRQTGELGQPQNDTVNEPCIVQLNNVVCASAVIDKQNGVNEITEAATESPLLRPRPPPPPTAPKKRNWKRDFWKRLSFSRSRIFQSFSIRKTTEESHSTKNIFRSLRHSLRRIRSFDKVSKLGKGVEKSASKSASVVLGSDCDYFNFQKELTTPEAVDKDEGTFTECYESTPIKPRRQFTQEKYLTGSEEILKKAFNSLKRKSHLQDNKSLFDLSSTVSYVFLEDLREKPLSTDDPIYSKFIDNCVNAFLDVHQKQIDNSLQLINKTIGDHIDLFSEDLDLISKSKKYQITELFGSKGVCVITNVFNQKQFIALKRDCPKNWIFFTSFLQHTDKPSSLFPEQQWICFPAQSITNLYIEKNFFQCINREFKLILDALMQLIVILYCQRMNNFDLKINPFNVMLISSDLSIIFILIDSDEEDNNAVAVDSGEWLQLGDSDVKDVRLAYQESLRKLNQNVERFLSLPENMCHLITASYPLDYLFFLLLKLNKDSGLLNDI